MLSIILTACFQSDYTRMVKSELAKGVRQDSILLGIKFGDTRDIFYGKCFDLNRAKLVTQGPGNRSVQYLFTDSVVHTQPTPMRLLFSPNFDQKEEIAQMNMEFTYPAWAPWNKQYQSDSLEVKVIELMMQWYQGNEFVMAELNDTTSLRAKVDGNRRLLIEKPDAQRVVVKVQNILHPAFRHSITAEAAESLTDKNE